MIFGGISKKHYYSAFPKNEKREFYKNFLKIKKSKKDDDDSDSEDDKVSGMKIDLSKVIGGASNSGVSRHKNHIYFYSEVSTESCLDLNNELVNLAKELQYYSLEHDCKPAKIYLHINSYGGELLASFSSVDYIKNSPVPVVSIIEGCAASAATLMSVVASERYMTPSSWMLIHQLRGGYWGKFEEMEEDLSNSRKFMEKIYEIYEAHTNLTRKELKKMLKRDEWWDYETCLKYGLIDGARDGWISNRVVKRSKKDGPVIVKENIEEKVKRLVKNAKLADPKKKKRDEKEKEKKKEKEKEREKGRISPGKKSEEKKTENYFGMVTRSISEKFGLHL